jgi:hypothetical protein
MWGISEQHRHLPVPLHTAKKPPHSRLRLGLHERLSRNTRSKRLKFAPLSDQAHLQRNQLPLLAIR